MRQSCGKQDRKDEESEENRKEYAEKAGGCAGGRLYGTRALPGGKAADGQQPADVVFVLDFSASMTWGVDSMSVSQEDGSDSRIQYMVNALNSAIDTLARANPDNRGNVGGLRRNENTDAGSENTGFCHSHPGKYHYDGRRGYYQ